MFAFSVSMEWNFFGKFYKLIVCQSVNYFVSLCKIREIMKKSPNYRRNHHVAVCLRGPKHSKHYPSKAIKKDEGDSLWKDNPHKKSHKDIDARWTKKGGETFYGYKNHAKVCSKTKLITGYDTTSASDHDSKRGAELVDDNDVAGERFWLDAGYVGTEGDFVNKSVTPIICEKGFRGHPLDEEQNKTTALNQRFVVEWNTCLVL